MKKPKCATRATNRFLDYLLNTSEVALEADAPTTVLG